ncbi:acyltransferase [Sphingobium aromaticiconvertens]|uniref:acyltransferase family protein n=1 Tax=Sphingobium aromaticiconvertens TaxID=365341 RepID=UPI0030179332
MSDDMDASRPQKLVGIQALRGIASLAVILYHVARHMDQVTASPLMMRFFQPGHAGVDLFFVLSGFIILHVHRIDIGQPDRLRHYVRQRFLRLMPIYWIALVLTALALIAAGHMVSSGALLWSATLLPTVQEPLLGIAWTLQHELIFYMVFALLIFSRRLGVTLLVIWTGWIMLAALGLVAAVVPDRITNLYNLEFLAGMGAAALLASGRITAPRMMTGAGATLLLAACVAESMGVLDGYGPLARLAYGVPSALLIAGLAAWEQARGMVVPAPLRALGEASYSLYLFQFLGLSAAWQIWQRLGLDAAAMPLLCYLVLAAAALIAGLAMSLLVEQPLLARLRRWRNPAYSCRSASMGLSAAARRAGK